MESKMASRVTNHDAAESPITDEDVRAKPQNEVRQIELSRGEHRTRELVRRDSFEVQVRWPADAKGRVGREDLVAAKTRSRKRIAAWPGLDARGEAIGEAIESLGK